MTDTALNASQARHRLLRAFAESLREAPYDSLSVSALLRRAGVGRTTFYAQFRDKEELFEVSVRGLGEGVARAALAERGPWGFLRPLSLHVDSHRSIYSGFVGRQSAAVLERQMHRLLAQLLTQDLALHGQSTPDKVQLAAAVGAVWGVMVAWIERRLSLEPEALAVQVAAQLSALFPRH